MFTLSRINSGGKVLWSWNKLPRLWSKVLDRGISPGTIKIVNKKTYTDEGKLINQQGKGKLFLSQYLLILF